MKDLLTKWEQMKATLDEDERTRLGKEILRAQAENLWVIGTVGGQPGVVLARNNFRNVPEVSFSDNPLLAPGHTHPEQYFFKR